MLGKLLIGILGLGGLVALSGKKGGAGTNPSGGGAVDRGYTIKACEIEIQDKGRALEYALAVGQAHGEVEFIAILLDGCALLKPLSTTFRQEAAFVYELLRRALGGRVSVSALTLEQANLQLAGLRHLFKLQNVDTTGWMEVVEGVQKVPKPDLPKPEPEPVQPEPEPPARGYSIGPNCGPIVVHNDLKALAHAREVGAVFPVAEWRPVLWDDCWAESWLKAPRFAYLMMHAAISGAVAAGKMDKNDGSMWLLELRAKAKDDGVPDFLDWPVELT